MSRSWRTAAVVLMLGPMVVPMSGAAAWAAPGRTSPPAGSLRATRLDLKSNAALVIDDLGGTVLFAKHPDQVAPIASITKLMTAMVVLDAQLPMDEPIEIDRADVDGLKHTHSRLPVGAQLERGDLLWVALMSSENRAAAALARTYPGGLTACVAAMNRKAEELGMLHTRFEDSSGLSKGNVSTAEDLSRMVRAAGRYPAIREYTTSTSHPVRLPGGRLLEFHNSNGLVKNNSWTIGLSKTGYINEAGRCLVMMAEISMRPVIIVLLDSWGKYTRLGDANRIRKWMETTLPRGSAERTGGGTIGRVGAGTRGTRHVRRAATPAATAAGSRAPTG